MAAAGASSMILPAYMTAEGAALGALLVGIVRAAAVRYWPEVELFTIYAVMALVLIVRPRGLFAAPEATGRVESRMSALVAQRTRLFETIAPVRRMAIRLAPRSQPIAAELARADLILRDHLAGLFAPELTALRPRERAEAIEALDALTSWETWERLRTAQRLEADQAARVVTATALCVLG